jgi:LysR family glycine cleavage system transcriptional activator
MSFRGIPALGREPLSPKLLPNALTVFELVARLESITGAALSLNVAASAISRHIANLEARLGIELFVRKGNRLTLTADGHDLAAAVRDGLGFIQHRVADIQLKRGGTVVLGCSPDMAMFWVMPRYDRIAAHFDMANFRMLTSNDYGEFDDPSVDLSIRLGKPEGRPELETIPLFERAVVPVCAPRLLKDRPELASGSAAALQQAPLLHFGFEDGGRMGWGEWFEGIKVPAGPRFTTFQAMLHAVIGGHGVALFVRKVVDGALRSGEIVALGEARVLQPAYHLVRRLPQRPAARRLADLLVD